MSAPHTGEMVYFAALELTIVTLRAALEKAKFAADKDMVAACELEIDRVTVKRDAVEERMQQRMGGS